MSIGWEVDSKMNKEDILYNLMFLEESPRLDDRPGSVFRAAMRELQRLG